MSCNICIHGTFQPPIPGISLISNLQNPIPTIYSQFIRLTIVCSRLSKEKEAFAETCVIIADVTVNVVTYFGINAGQCQNISSSHSLRPGLVYAQGR